MPGIRRLFAVFAVIVGIMSSADAKDNRNILLIIGDDIGWSDLGSYGGEIETPTLDELAKSGVQFTNFHSSPVCAPTRAMMLTGVDNHLSGLGNFNYAPYPEHAGQPGYEGYLRTDVPTVAQKLRDAGYHTYVAGKWHLGRRPELLPPARGFEKSFVLGGGGANSFDNRGFLASRPTEQWFRDGRKVSRGYAGIYSDDMYYEELTKMIGSNLQDDQPFFAYLSFQSAHWPLQAPAEYIQKYAGRYKGGWDKLREERLARQKKLGLVPTSTRLGRLSPTAPAWDDLDDETKARKAREMAIYAAMIEYEDHTIGRVLDYLREHGQLENTVVIYTVDNGAEAFDTFGPLANEIQIRFVRENFDLSIEAMGTAESFITYGPAWAAASATPLSWHKGYVSEGGTRVPFIVNEPGSKSADKLHTRLTHIRDIAATILDIAGVDTNPPRPDGKRFPMMEGRSVMGVVRGETQLVRPENEPIGWEMFGNAVLAMGDWKLQRIRPGMRGSGKWELYNLTEDPGETKDLSSVEVAQFRLMRDLYETYALKSNVRPIDDDWNPYASVGLEE